MLSAMAQEYERRTQPFIPPAPADDQPPDFILGLDLGQAQDFSALCVVERRELADAGRTVRDYSVRRLHRWKLGTPYTVIVTDLQRFAAQPGLSGRPLVVDGTGCGRPVVDMIQAADFDMDVRPVAVHGGHDTAFSEGYWRVPKKDLVAVMQTLIQAGRFHIAPELAEAEALGKELQAFRAKINIATGNETLEAWRERDHDDLVFAVALACWFGQNGMRRFTIG